MSLTLKQSQAINQLASHLYDFLPGKAHPFADQAISFEGIAYNLGLGRHWTGRSKLPDITHLLTVALEYESGRLFCPLVLEVVRRGMGYRTNKGSPIGRGEIDRLSELVAEVGFKIPELRDRGFLESLPGAPAAEEESGVSVSTALLDDLREDLHELRNLDPQPRGYAFQRFLSKLFEAFGLAPGSPFRILGEQIDGSFQFQEETYLLEATWRGQRVGQEELNAFSGKVHGKAAWSRGLHISYSGYSPDGLEAFARGKPTKVVCMDGLDMHDMLDRGLDLREVLARKVRRAAETNDAYVPVRELFP